MFVLCTYAYSVSGVYIVICDVGSLHLMESIVNLSLQKYSPWVGSYIKKTINIFGETSSAESPLGSGAHLHIDV